MNHDAVSKPREAAAQRLRVPAPHHEGGRGRPSQDRRQMLNAMMWILRTGLLRNDLPDRFGPWQKVYHRFNQGRKDGVFDIQWPQEPPDHALGQSRGELGSRLPLVTDGSGLPLACDLPL